MRYEPHENELAAVPQMVDDELLEYFLYTVFETDEVWGLKDGPQWLMRSVDGHDTLAVWPYQCYASNAAADHWPALSPTADTLEFFTYQLLNRAAQQGLIVEIMPRGSQTAGCLITPQRLFAMIENMMESRDSNVGD